MEHQAQMLLRHVSPTVGERFAAELDVNIDRLRTMQASTFFSITQAYARAEAGQAELVGFLSTFIRDRLVSERPRTYVLEFQVNNGRPLLTAFQQTTPRDPFGDNASKSPFADGGARLRVAAKPAAEHHGPRRRPRQRLRKPPCAPLPPDAPPPPPPRVRVRSRPRRRMAGMRVALGVRPCPDPSRSGRRRLDRLGRRRNGRPLRLRLFRRGILSRHPHLPAPAHMECQEGGPARIRTWIRNWMRAVAA